MAEDVILSVKNISKSFVDLQVLKKISFDIHKGEKIAILGPSGSGKSTILRCINQLETYDSGEINYMGKPVNSGQALHELRQHIGMVFQRFNVFTHMSVLQNVIEAPVHVKSVIFFKAKSFHIQRKPLTCLVKNLSGGGILFIKILSHSSLLCSLSREKKCDLTHKFQFLSTTHPSLLPAF